MRGLQQAGHKVTLLALQGRQVLCTQDLQVFKSDRMPANHYGQLGWSGTTLFKRFESSVRRLQPVLRFPYLALFDSYRMAEAGYINLEGINLIHERYNLLALGGVLASRKLGIPYVLEVNADLLEQRKYKGIPEKGLRRQFAIWATRMSFKSAAKIICISASLKEHLKTQWIVDEDKLAVLPCAADVDNFKPYNNLEQLRGSLGLTNEPVVVWVGGFYPWHDLGLLLESFRQVLQKCPNAKLLLVGDGQTRTSVANMIMNNGLRHSVIMTGAVAHRVVPQILSIADVAVDPHAPVPVTSGGTGAPLKLFEYMAAAKAIVSTAMNESSGVIQDGDTGILVEAGDIKGFAEAILALINDPAERRRLGQNAREKAVEQYSWQQYTKRLEDIYKTVLGNAPSGSTAIDNS